jgi:hypothetical protein
MIGIVDGNGGNGGNGASCLCPDCSGCDRTIYERSVADFEAAMPAVWAVIGRCTPVTLMMNARELQCAAFLAVTADARVAPTAAVDALKKILSNSYRHAFSAFMASLNDYPEELRESVIADLKSDEAKERGIHAFEGVEGVPSGVLLN